MYFEGNMSSESIVSNALDRSVEKTRVNLFKAFCCSIQCLVRSKACWQECFFLKPNWVSDNMSLALQNLENWSSSKITLVKDSPHRRVNDTIKLGGLTFTQRYYPSITTESRWKIRSLAVTTSMRHGFLKRQMILHMTHSFIVPTSHMIISNSLWLKTL